MSNSIIRLFFEKKKCNKNFDKIQFPMFKKIKMLRQCAKRQLAERQLAKSQAVHFGEWCLWFWLCLVLSSVDKFELTGQNLG